MKNINLGYACINMELSNPQQWGGQPRGVERITTNRSMIRRTFDERGLPYASELALKNCQDLLKILQWNEKNDINFFRLSSDLFPWASEYKLSDLPDFNAIHSALQKAGEFASLRGHRITAHPGPFNKLTSPDERVIQNTIRDLDHHGEVFDMLGLSRTPYNKLNIHVGAHYNNKPMALANFNKNFHRLSEAAKSRLTVENDDKASLYSTKELHDEVYLKIGIPIVHDIHHHFFCTGGLDQEEALLTAAVTWGDIKPVIHYSQSRSVEHKDPKIRDNAHSDSYWTAVDTHGLDVDVMLECKHKEVGLMKMRELLLSA
jgi:UV DNA damage endonuclease